MNPESMGHQSQDSSNNEPVTPEHSEFWHGIEDLPLSEQNVTRIEISEQERDERIAKIRAEVAEIRRLHASVERDIHANDEIKSTLRSQISLIEAVKPADRDGYISVEHTTLKKKLAERIRIGESLMASHRTNTAYYNARLGDLHREFVMLKNIKF